MVEDSGGDSKQPNMLRDVAGMGQAREMVDRLAQMSPHLAGVAHYEGLFRSRRRRSGIEQLPAAIVFTDSLI